MTNVGIEGRITFHLALATGVGQPVDGCEKVAVFSLDLGYPRSPASVERGATENWSGQAIELQFRVSRHVSQAGLRTDRPRQAAQSRANVNLAR